MACNCKKKYDLISEKYADEKGEDEEKEGFLFKFFKIIFQIIFGIIVGCILIVMVIPLLVFVIFCLVTGTQPHIRIYNIRKRWESFKEKFRKKDETSV